jgi:hypothetical protein
MPLKHVSLFGMSGLLLIVKNAKLERMIHNRKTPLHRKTEKLIGVPNIAWHKYVFTK